MHSYSNRFAVSSLIVSCLLLLCLGFKGESKPRQAILQTTSNTRPLKTNFTDLTIDNTDAINLVADFIVSNYADQDKLQNKPHPSLTFKIFDAKDKNLLDNKNVARISINSSKYIPTTFTASRNTKIASNRSIPKTSVIHKKQEEDTTTASRLPIIISSIVDKSIRAKLPIFKTHEGYEVIFMYHQGKWLGYVTQHLAIGYRIFILPVYGEIGFSIDNLLSSDPEWQEKHIYITNKSLTKDASCVYITNVETKEDGLKIDVKATITNLMLGYYLADPSYNIKPGSLKKLEGMLIEISSLIESLKVNLAISSINPNPRKVRKKLEQIIYKYLNRQIRLKNYALAYNQLLTKIIKQISLADNLAATENTSDYLENHLVIVKIGLQRIYPLLLEFKSMRNKQTVDFDLTKLINSLEINVVSKGVTDNSKYLFPKDLGPFVHSQQQGNIKISSVFPDLSPHSPQNILLEEGTDKDNRLYESAEHKYIDSIRTYLDEYDLPGSMHIPRFIQLNTGDIVKITFGSSLRNPEKFIISADRLVDQRLIPSLVQALNKTNETVKIYSIHISATTNGHDGKQYANSNHRKENGARALDISKINGKNVADLGPKSPLVIAFQNALDETPYVRENFGPYFRHKKRKIYRSTALREDHRNHIHFSINR